MTRAEKDAIAEDLHGGEHRDNIGHWGHRKDLDGCGWRIVRVARTPVAAKWRARKGNELGQRKQDQPEG